MITESSKHNLAPMGSKKGSKSGQTESRASPRRFQTFDKGLGFHPFEEGLPYGSSINKTPSKKPHLPRRKLDKSILETAKSAAVRNRNNVNEDVTRSFDFLFSRGLAYLLDFAINILFLSGVLFLSCLILEVSALEFFSVIGFNETVVFALAFHFLVVLSQEILTKTSVGKLVFSIRLIGSPIRIFCRGFLFLATSIPFGVGQLWSVFLISKGKSGRTLYDILSGVSINENSANP